MEKDVRERFIVEIRYFDGTKECAQQLVEWAGGGLRQATTNYDEEILLINTFGDDWFVVNSAMYITKSSDGDLTPITVENFESEYVKI